ncbi:MAG: O-antigen ligase family protein [Ignavibacteriales bacterium]|nr:O-antigen ligase family protein [Ignavibacteriales bacterium]
MKIITDFNDNQYSVKNNIQLFSIGIGFSIVLVLSFYFGLPLELFFLLLGVIICSALLFSFNLTYYIFLALAFVPYVYILRVHPAVVFSIFLLISALINFKGNLIKEVNNQLWFPLLLYFVSTLPSFVNTPAPLLSLRDLSNLISLIIVFFVTILGFPSKKKMMFVFFIFITAIFLHSLFVIYLGVTTGKRVLGILGVYYIDYAGLGSVITFILALYMKGLKKAIFSAIFIIITLGLILTQTRNAWFSAVFTIGTLILFLFFNAKKAYMKRSILIFLTLAVIVLLIVSSSSTGVDVGDRLDVNKRVVSLTGDPESVGLNSFVSRAMIWHTALYAFLEHPVIGIGPYSFKHTSQLYYVIPKGFYDLYVEGRTPHITYLQVLTETGIVGFMAFLFFIIALIKLLVQSLKLLIERDDFIITLMIIWSLVYIIFSMMMTESWLYGPYIVWLGVLLGFLVNNKKRLEKN